MTGVNYASGAVPDDYRCASCGAHGCKLWRLANRVTPLLCVACAETSTGARLDTWPKAGNQIGGFVPAIPCEDDTGFWGYMFVPAEAGAWWRALPMALPQPKVKP